MPDLVNHTYRLEWDEEYAYWYIEIGENLPPELDGAKAGDWLSVTVRSMTFHAERARHGDTVIRRPQEIS